MPRGRPAKPTALKALTGNPGNRPLNRREPKPPPFVQTEPPRWLVDKDAIIIWHDLTPVLGEQMQVLTEADVVAFAMLCERVAEYRRLVIDIRTYGRTYTTVNNQGGEMRRSRPEVAQFNEVFRQVKRYPAYVRICAGDDWWCDRCGRLAPCRVTEDELCDECLEPVRRVNVVLKYGLGA